MKTIRQWLSRMWNVAPDTDLIEAYRTTFSTAAGKQVLGHLVDSVYCSVYEGKDPSECLTHNGRRSVVHEILQNIDMARNPQKYEARVKEVDDDLAR